MSDTSPRKFVCAYWKCGFHGLKDSFLIAPDPFNEGDTLMACPECRSDDNVRLACDEQDCWKEATCGTPVNDERRYLNVCGEHIRKYMK